MFRTLMQAQRAHAACLIHRGETNLLSGIVRSSPTPSSARLSLRWPVTHRDFSSSSIRGYPRRTVANVKTKFAQYPVWRPFVFCTLFTICSFGTAYVLDIDAPRTLDPDDTDALNDSHDGEHCDDPLKKVRVMMALVGLNGLVYAVHTIHPATGRLANSDVLRRVQRFVRRYGSMTIHNAESRPVTLLTSGFSHTKGLHLTVNMILLYTFGTMVFDSMGTKQFLAFYGSALCWSSFAHIGAGVLRARLGHGIPPVHLGARGACYALLGLAAFHNPAATLPVPLPQNPDLTVPVPAFYDLAMGFSILSLCLGWPSRLGHVANLAGGWWGKFYGSSGCAEMWDASKCLRDEQHRGPHIEGYIRWLKVDHCSGTGQPWSLHAVREWLSSTIFSRSKGPARKSDAVERNEQPARRAEQEIEFVDPGEEHRGPHFTINICWTTGAHSAEQTGDPSTLHVIREWLSAIFSRSKETDGEGDAEERTEQLEKHWQWKTRWAKKKDVDSAEQIEDRAEQTKDLSSLCVVREWLFTILRVSKGTAREGDAEERNEQPARRAERDPDIGWSFPWTPTKGVESAEQTEDPAEQTKDPSSLHGVREWLSNILRRSKGTAREGDAEERNVQPARGAEQEKGSSESLFGLFWRRESTKCVDSADQTQEPSTLHVVREWLFTIPGRSKETAREGDAEERNVQPARGAEQEKQSSDPVKTCTKVDKRSETGHSWSLHALYERLPYTIFSRTRPLVSVGYWQAASGAEQEKRFSDLVTKVDKRSETGLSWILHAVYERLPYTIFSRNRRPARVGEPEPARVAEREGILRTDQEREKSST